VSEKWKRRFEALSRAGTLSFWGVHSNAAALTKAERQDLSFDTLAFLFGPLAYWGRQMWLRGTLIFAFSVPLYLAAFVLQSTLGWNHNYLSWGVSIAVGAWCATHLYYDYYRQTVHGERVWSWAERWKWPVLGLGTACIAVLIAMVVIYGPSPLPGCNDSESLATVERLINDLPVVKARGIRFVSLKTVQEQGQNRSEGIRVCTATLVTTAGEDALRYQIKWTDRWKQQFLILAQVNPDEGGSSTDSTVDGDMVATFTNAYAMAKRNGDVLNACVNAGLLATVFMQGNDEPNYRKWKQIQDECQRSMTR